MRLSLLDKLKMGCWRPHTAKDWKVFGLLIGNIVSILAFTISTAIAFSPVYVAFGIAIFISIAQLSILFVVKYRESNFNFTSELRIMALIIAILLIGWVIYYTFGVLK